MEKYLNDYLLSIPIINLGERIKMSEIVWFWNKGNTKVFTRDIKVAEEALREGFLVIGKRVNNIITYK